VRVSEIFLVHGDVQGVGYRWWTRREAARLGLSGTVRNLTDGTVEVMCSGTPDMLERLEEALCRGPSLSRVERVVRSPGSPGFEVVGFEIVD
jgi:acylphosphatase